ncbi:FkbM family methyltransferase [Falsiroseomonas tokyonensis]|uniref:FkbM family methyltransferase n=1 Tax=Falsiroseomonas tokyonensis TaxID=430521 RepID=A0ABV7C1E1_9PROT|nr:FkbM family methyltransferase [Falsiroseomonas tokyonensis]MBU8541645.1 FkbM family methyltransferase [Falsiroseomonas tokyonensis]
MADMTAWEPPMNVEERLKALLLPARLQLRYQVAREKACGEAEIRMVPFLADQSRASVDVGANRGVWSEVLRCHSRCVHAFEPNPKIYRLLRRSAGIGVTTYPIALSDRSGTSALMVPRGSRGYSNQGASLNPKKIGAAEHRSVEVETKRLDDLDLGPIGFIKIDVEGHEMAVIAGAARTLALWRPNLVVEIEERHTRRPLVELLGEICAHGYDAFALDQGVLRRVQQIDLAQRHAQSANLQDYILNWIFLPR